MRGFGISLGAVCLVLSATAGAAGAREAPASPSARGYVVVYTTKRPAVRTATAASATTSRLATRHGFRARLRYRSALRGFAARLDRRQATALRRDQRVAMVYPDRVLRASGEVAVVPGEEVPTGVARIGAVAGGYAHRASSAGVAVLDTGIDPDHPQLDVRAGRNCIDMGQEPNDNNGHGTFVAGVIAARNDGSGVIGVAPGTPVWAVKTLNSIGEGELSEVVCGIDWVTANARALGIRVANLSLGGSGSRGGCTDDPLHLAICNSTAAGITYVAAAGNDGSDLGGSPEEIPAVYPEVLAVTGVADGDGLPGGLVSPTCAGVTGENDDQPYSFSNFATRPEDAAHLIAAPGVCILSTDRHGATQVGTGTSAAAPHVSGVVSLCAGELGSPAACAGMTPVEVIEQVRADAALRAPSTGGFFGDPDHSFGPYFGHLVSGVEPGVRRLPAPSGSSRPAGNTPDTSVALGSLKVPKTQFLRKLRVKVLLNEAGKASASATIRVSARGGKAAALFRLRSPGQRLSAFKTATLRLGRPARRVRDLRRVLAATGGRTATITVRLSDGAGNVLVKHRKVRVRR